MNASAKWRVCIMFLLFSGHHAVSLQSPRPHDPNGPIIYPEDYCPKVKDGEEFDYVVVGSGKVIMGLVCKSLTEDGMIFGDPFLKEVYHYLILGPAGATVSRRLAENAKMKVLLIEAGGDPIKVSDIPAGTGLSADMLWDVQTQPSDNMCTGYPGNSCRYVLAKFLGGASVVNLMMNSRGNPKDYNEWGSTPGCSGWSWKDMFPYFLKLENYKDPQHLSSPDLGYHRTGGPFTTTPSQIDPQSNEFRQAFQSAIMNLDVPFNSDFNGKSQIGVGAVTGLLGENGYRENVAKAYLLDIPNNMKVCKYAVVSRVLFNDNTASGVEYTYNGTTKNVKVRKEAVLSGGAIGTPQILERSGIGDSNVLKNVGVDVVQELPGVGANLQEQFLNVGCAFQIDFQTASARNPMSLAMTSLSIFLNMTDYKNPVPDVQWIFTSYYPNSMRFKESITKQFAAASNSSYLLLAGSEVLRQANRGYVHINGTDPTKSPDFNPNQFTSEEESRLTTESCRLIRKAMDDAKVKKFNPRPFVLDECKTYEFNSEDEIMCAARLIAFPTYHMAGGAVMGDIKNNKMAVVDNKLRVHGIKRLRIADLSVMPGVPRGNTEIPSIAIGEKAADVIKRKQR